MAFNRFLNKFFTTADSNAIGRAIEDANFQATMRRRSHERRWYDNQYFDDGYHFRLVSKRTGRVIDTVNRTSGYVERAIPRASRQIRGIGNLLFSPEYYPVVYPERVTEEDFRDKLTGQVNQQAFLQEQEKAKQNARKQGIWLTTTWEDDLELDIKLIQQILGAAKHSIGYIQIYTDPVTNRICAENLDGFDLIHYGDMKEMDDLPFVTKATPWDFQEVINHEFFDEEKRYKLNPDNEYATSEIKNAYMRTRFGAKLNTPAQNTIIVRESFIKEFLNSDNWDLAKKLSEETGAMEGKSKGDMIMRHPFSAGGVTLKDEYVDYDNYPFADFRFEPGYLYQVPLIERFIPLNKALDVVVTRLEKWVNSMVVGVYMTRKGENIEMNNFPGGQQVMYEQAPPQQMQVTNAGQTPFAFAEMLDKYIEEQGSSTFTLNSLPQGVTANAAFESSQQREYANMKFATKMFKKNITRIANLMMERGHKDYIEPQDVSYKEDGKASYFSVIGAEGAKLHKKINKKIPNDIVTLDKKAKIHIEIDQGLGLTAAGKKESMAQLMQTTIELYKQGFIGQKGMAILVKRYIEIYGFGSTEEFMEGLEDDLANGNMTDEQMMKMKIAIVQALKESEAVGPKAEKRLVDSTKLGVLQTMKDAGLLDQLNQKGDISTETDDLIKLYKDASPEIRRQIEQKLGLQPASDEPISPTQATSAKQLHEIVKGNKQHQLDVNKHVADTTLQAVQIKNQQEQAEKSNQLQQQTSQNSLEAK